MPALQYWFSGAALWLAGSFTFGIGVAIFEIKELISDKALFICILVAVSFALLAWRTAARQEEQNTNFENSLKTIAETMKINTHQPTLVMAQEIIKQIKGGKGGNAEAEDGGEAHGGPGGKGGIGPGGDGGAAKAKGHGSFAAGGAGGNAAQLDGRGGPRTKSPGETNNLPTNLWAYGYGGAGANAPEYNRRLKILTEIRSEYMAMFPDSVQFISAGIDQVPISWVNKRLEEKSEPWRVIEMNDGGYEMPPLTTNRTY